MVSHDEAIELLEEAHDFVNGDPSDRIQEFFVAKEEEIESEDENGDTETETRLNVGEMPFHENIFTELSSIFVEELYKEVSSVARSDDKELSEYSASNIEKNSVPLQYLDVDEIPDYEIFERFTRENGFEETDFESFGNPGFQVLRIRDGLHQNVFLGFRKFSTRQIVGSSWKVKLLMRDSEYNEFKDNLYALPEKLDAFVFNGTLFVRNQRGFEDIFNYFNEYQETAEEVFSSMESGEIRIHNLDEFRTAVLQDRGALRKMVQVEERGMYEQLEREDVEEVIDKFEINVNTAEVDGDWGLILPSRGDKRELISLLNDDHLYSEITEQRYQARVKERRGN